MFPRFVFDERPRSCFLLQPLKTAHSAPYKTEASFAVALKSQRFVVLARHTGRVLARGEVRAVVHASTRTVAILAQGTRSGDALCAALLLSRAASRLCVSSYQQGCKKPCVRRRLVFDERLRTFFSSAVVEDITQCAIRNVGIVCRGTEKRRAGIVVRT